MHKFERFECNWVAREGELLHGMIGKHSSFMKESHRTEIKSLFVHKVIITSSFLMQPLEVKLANQESDLVALLKRLPLGPTELSTIREKADLMRTGSHNARGESLLPLMLAAFIFDALVASGEILR